MSVKFFNNTELIVCNIHTELHINIKNKIKSLCMSNQNTCPSFFNMKKIRNLQIQECSFVKIPDNICMLKKLQILFLDNTPIKEFPNICNLTNLVALKIVNTQICKIPDDINNLQNIIMFVMTSKIHVHHINKILESKNLKILCVLIRDGDNYFFEQSDIKQLINLEVICLTTNIKYSNPISYLPKLKYDFQYSDEINTNYNVHSYLNIICDIMKPYNIKLY